MKRGLKYDFTLIHILLIPIGVAINVVGYQLSSILKLPVFLDLIGTCIVAMLAGPWVGLATGLLGSLVNGMVNPIAIPFGIVAGAIGFSVGILSRFKMFNNVATYLIAAVIVTIVGTVTASPIAILLFGGVTGSATDIITAVFVQAGKDIANAVFSQTLIVSSYNNIINITLAYIVVRKMSDRYLSKLNYGFVYISKKSKKYQLSKDATL